MILEQAYYARVVSEPQQHLGLAAQTGTVCRFDAMGPLDGHAPLIASTNSEVDLCLTPASEWSDDEQAVAGARAPATALTPLR